MLWSTVSLLIWIWTHQLYRLQIVQLQQNSLTSTTQNKAVSKELSLSISRVQSLQSELDDKSRQVSELSGRLDRLEAETGQLTQQLTASCLERQSREWVAHRHAVSHCVTLCHTVSHCVTSSHDWHRHCVIPSHCVTAPRDCHRQYIQISHKVAMLFVSANLYQSLRCRWINYAVTLVNVRRRSRRWVRSMPTPNVSCRSSVSPASLYLTLMARILHSVCAGVTGVPWGGVSAGGTADELRERSGRPDWWPRVHQIWTRTPPTTTQDGDWQVFTCSPLTPVHKPI